MKEHDRQHSDRTETIDIGAVGQLYAHRYSLPCRARRNNMRRYGKRRFSGECDLGSSVGERGEQAGKAAENEHPH
jgi:hypothetical protein